MTPNEQRCCEQLAEALRKRIDADPTGAWATEAILLAEYDRLRTHPAEGGEGREALFQSLLDGERRILNLIPMVALDGSTSGAARHEIREVFAELRIPAPPPQPVAPERGEAKAVAWRQHTPLDNWRFSTINRSADDGWEPLYATPQPPPAPTFRELTIEDENALAESLQKIIRVYGITLANIRVGVPDPKEYAARALKEAADIEGAALNAIGAKVERA